MSPERMALLAHNEEYLSETVMQDLWGDLDGQYKVGHRASSVRDQVKASVDFVHRYGSSHYTDEVY